MLRGAAINENWALVKKSLWVYQIALASKGSVGRFLVGAILLLPVSIPLDCGTIDHFISTNSNYIR